MKNLTHPVCGFTRGNVIFRKLPKKICKLAKVSGPYLPIHLNSSYGQSQAKNTVRSTFLTMTFDLDLLHHSFTYQYQRPYQKNQGKARKSGPEIT